MDPETQKKFAMLLRNAASQTMSESDFWSKFNHLTDSVDDPIAGFAYEAATHYWGNFHERNLLWMQVKPDRYEVRRGKDQLNLIADALDENWPASKLKLELDNI
jgi:hypothetical protein